MARCWASRPVNDSSLCAVTPRYVRRNKSVCIDWSVLEPFRHAWPWADNGRPPKNTPWVMVERLKLMFSHLWETIAKLQSVTCHIGSHSVIHYPTQVKMSCLNPSQRGRYSIYLRRMDGRLSWPVCWLYTYTWGIKNTQKFIDHNAKADYWILIISGTTILDTTCHKTVMLCSSKFMECCLEISTNSKSDWLKSEAERYQHCYQRMENASPYLCLHKWPIFQMFTVSSCTTKQFDKLSTKLLEIWEKMCQMCIILIK